jgi:P-type conjugative transfer protein TrbJ
MKKYFFSLSATLLMVMALAAPAKALTVVCTNCSDVWTQQMERATSLEQLKSMLDTYREAIEQTRQQIALVQNNIQQYQNMIKNTLSLPNDLINLVKGEFAELAKLTNEINTLKNDVLATGEIFDDLYPDLDLIKNLAGGNGDMSIKDVWSKWSQETDRAAKATFQVTGSQLKDLAENSEALDRHIDNLLSTPEGQMQAIQSGNSLAAMQVNEMRQLRALMATSIQSTTQAMMKDEKREQLSVERREQLMDKSGLASQYREYK